MPLCFDQRMRIHVLKPAHHLCCLLKPALHSLGRMTHHCTPDGHLVLRTRVAADEQWPQPEAYNDRFSVDLMRPGVSKLSLTADLVAQIFQGNITSFNNPAIVALNPGLV